MVEQEGVVIYNYKDTFFCCCVAKDRLCEDMVDEHMLVYVCSGEMTLIAKNKKYFLKKGDYFFIKRNHILRKIKQPTRSGEPFKGLFLKLKKPFLKNLLSENNFAIPQIVNPVITKTDCVILDKHPFLKGLFSSLEQYFDTKEYPSKELMDIKMREAVFSLLQINPDFGAILFDFAEPWKIDLSDFMNKNYKYDLSIEDFAHYTGRSLSTFKKDFYNTFGCTPSRWIVKKRLHEAKRLIQDESKRVVDVYLEVGFKNFSHFSTAFKKEFGLSPSSINVNHSKAFTDSSML